MDRPTERTDRLRVREERTSERSPSLFHKREGSSSSGGQTAVHTAAASANGRRIDNRQRRTALCWLDDDDMVCRCEVCGEWLMNGQE